MKTPIVPLWKHRLCLWKHLIVDLWKHLLCLWKYWLCLCENTDCASMKTRIVPLWKYWLCLSLKTQLLWLCLAENAAVLSLKTLHVLTQILSSWQSIEIALPLMYLCRPQLTKCSPIWDTQKADATFNLPVFQTALKTNYIGRCVFYTEKTGSTMDDGRLLSEKGRNAMWINSILCLFIEHCAIEARWFFGQNWKPRRTTASARAVHFRVSHFNGPERLAYSFWMIHTSFSLW
jgi:hypothetical protein